LTAAQAKPAPIESTMTTKSSTITLTFAIAASFRSLQRAV
jgi:hypothetical protein